MMTSLKANRRVSLQGRLERGLGTDATCSPDILSASQLAVMIPQHGLCHPVPSSDAGAVAWGCEPQRDCEWKEAFIFPSQLLAGSLVISSRHLRNTGASRPRPQGPHLGVCFPGPTCSIFSPSFSVPRMCAHTHILFLILFM